MADKLIGSYGGDDLASFNNDFKLIGTDGTTTRNLSLGTLSSYIGADTMLSNLQLSGLLSDYLTSSMVTNPLNVASKNGFHGLWSEYTGAATDYFPPYTGVFIGFTIKMSFNADWHFVKTINLYDHTSYYNVCTRNSEGNLAWSGWIATSI